MQEKTLKVNSASGLHARSAQMIVRTMAKYDSKVTLSNENAEANAASVLDLMMLAAAPGTEVEALVKGEDEEKAMQALEDLFENNFYRDDPNG